MSGSWGEHADEVLAEVFAALQKDASEQEIKAALREAYPFGERGYWPYKVWLERCRAWKAARKLGRSAPAPNARHHRPDRDTGDLFA